MTDRPIIFSGPMVRAILAGEKTQTRRVAKRQDIFYRNARPFVPVGVHRELPYSKPGWEIADRLWVRESYIPDPPADDDAWDDFDWTFVNFDGCGRKLDMIPPTLRTREHVIYKADPKWAECQSWTWRPSLFMPRWASRLTLTVTDVRVERLQAISEADAKAEGIAHAVPPFGDWSLISPLAGVAWKPADNPPPQIRFAYLWNSINGKRPGAAWADNPWIVAVTFSAERRNIDSPCRWPEQVSA